MQLVALGEKNDFKIKRKFLKKKKVLFSYCHACSIKVIYNHVEFLLSHSESKGEEEERQNVYKFLGDGE